MYHWVENRALTNRERARLQTFPDTFVFEGNKEAIRRQIGMAVPPEGAKVLFEAIIKTQRALIMNRLNRTSSNSYAEKFAFLQCQKLRTYPLQIAVFIRAMVIVSKLGTNWSGEQTNKMNLPNYLKNSASKAVTTEGKYSAVVHDPM